MSRKKSPAAPVKKRDKNKVVVQKTDPLHIFYSSLLKENANSKIALDWLKKHTE